MQEATVERERLMEEATIEREKRMQEDSVKREAQLEKRILAAIKVIKHIFIFTTERNIFIKLQKV